MIESLRARWAIIIAVIVATVIWTIPNFVNLEGKWWPTKAKMVLGLDIQGGSHLVLRVDVENAIRQDATRTAATLQQSLRDKQVNVKSATVTDPLRGAIRIELNNAADGAKVRDFLASDYSYVFSVASTTDTHVDVEFNELYVRDFRNNLLEQAIAVIRNRIDEFGVAEPSITAQGTDRILVQLPGIKDASGAKDLINRTARLDFMMVADDRVNLDQLITEAEKSGNFRLEGTQGQQAATAEGQAAPAEGTTYLKYSAYVDKLNETLAGKIPENTRVMFEKPENAESLVVARVPYLLRTNEIVTGDRLTNANVNVDQYGKPIVQFQFDPQGTQDFGKLTTNNVNKPMAIVLDKVVVSAPNIQTPITGGSGQITLGGGRDRDTSLKEAKLIATALRAGALPASLEQLEERTVGPSLGADAIAKGRMGTIIAALAVFAFMILFYKGFGLVADLALALNLAMTVAILSSLNATLTLPGVAGLALTLGISVDASVIIFERIKEELGKGATLQAAIREGYDKAFSSIFDSNLTSIAVCIVLMYYGTGPVRGFAVTLLTGLVITTFTAVFFTRAVLDTAIFKWKWNFTPSWKPAR